MYKRVQILVGDLWAAYNKSSTKTHPDGSVNIYYFDDLDKLTMFADYRVPQILRNMNILEYSTELAGKIDSFTELYHGGHEEVEIRCCTIIAVERLKSQCNSILSDQKHDRLLYSIELDWLLWNKGEEIKDTILPHHRTLTIYY